MADSPREELDPQSVPRTTRQERVRDRAEAVTAPRFGSCQRDTTGSKDTAPTACGRCRHQRSTDRRNNQRHRTLIRELGRRLGEPTPGNHQGDNYKRDANPGTPDRENSETTCSGHLPDGKRPKAFSEPRGPAAPHRRALLGRRTASAERSSTPKYPNGRFDPAHELVSKRPQSGERKTHHLDATTRGST
jgi:hypothetical protein